jgi:hypothetical protein
MGYREPRKDFAAQQSHVNAKRRIKTHAININVNHHTEVPRYRNITGDINLINKYWNLRK